MSRRPTRRLESYGLRGLSIREMRAMDKQQAAAILLESGRSARLPLYLLLLPPALVLAVGLFAPIDILDRWPWLSTAIEKLFCWFPFLSRHAQYSDYPQVVSVVKALSFSLSIPGAFFWWLLMWRRRHVGVLSIARGDRPSPFKPTTELIGLFLLAAFVVGLWFLPGDPSFMKGITTKSRLGLSVIEASGLLSLTFIPGFVIVVLYWRYRLRPSSSFQ